MANGKRSSSRTRSIRFCKPATVYLWIATEEGLARFDGLRLTVFDKDNTPEFTGNVIRDLLEDRSGAPWILTPNQLIRRETGAFKTYSVGDDLPEGEISSFLEDREGGLWLATSAGLVRVRDNRLDTYTTRDGLPSDAVESSRRWSGQRAVGRHC
ncbi:MAG: two-component regulator propeller domain-containing protein [Pyrinomonadaceae bacterium]